MCVCVDCFVLLLLLFCAFVMIFFGYVVISSCFSSNVTFTQFNQSELRLSDIAILSAYRKWRCTDANKRKLADGRHQTTRRTNSACSLNVTLLAALKFSPEGEE